jgi:hypothetical protein
VIFLNGSKRVYIKRRFCAIIFALAAVCFMSGEAVASDSTIGDNSSVDLSNPTASGTGWLWNKTSNTLTLSDAFQTNSDRAIEIVPGGSDPVKIVYEGTAGIEITGLSSELALTLVGNDTGVLSIVGNNDPAIYVEDDLTITGGRISVGGSAGYSGLIELDGAFNVTGGDINVDVTGSAMSAIYANGVNISGGDVFVKYPYGNAITSTDDFSVSGGTVTVIANGQPAILCTGSSNILISGGLVTATTGGGNFAAILSGTVAGAKVAITGGTVIATSDGTGANGAAIRARNGLVNIENATVCAVATKAEGTAISAKTDITFKYANVTAKGGAGTTNGYGLFSGSSTIKIRYSDVALTGGASENGTNVPDEDILVYQSTITVGERIDTEEPPVVPPPPAASSSGGCMSGASGFLAIFAAAGMLSLKKRAL